MQYRIKEVNGWKLKSIHLSSKTKSWSLKETESRTAGRKPKTAKAKTLAPYIDRKETKMTEIENLDFFAKRAKEAISAGINEDGEMDDDFIAEEINRILMETGKSPFSEEELGRMKASFAENREDMETTEGKITYLIQATAENFYEFVRFSIGMQELIQGMLESAAKSPNHFSRFARETLDKLKKEDTDQ